MVSTGFDRTQRIASELKKDLAFFIQHELADPAFNAVTITAARVSRDLSYATVYFTLMGEEDEAVARDVQKRLTKASGFLRKLISKRLTTRITPQLRFFYDESIRRGSNLEALIDAAVKDDQSNLSEHPSEGTDG